MTNNDENNLLISYNNWSGQPVASVDLALIIIASPRTQGVTTKEILNTAPKRGDLNIEAMAFTATGKMLIGLR